jgi:hypothetical protein
VLLQYHNSAGEWAAHRPPGGQLLPTRRETQENQQLCEHQLEQRAERRREEQLEQLPERVQEQEEVQVEVKVEIQEEVKVKVEVEIQEKVQASTRLRTFLPVLPDELRRVLQETKLRLQREVEGRISPARHHQKAAIEADVAGECACAPARCVWLGLAADDRLE